MKKSQRLEQIPAAGFDRVERALVGGRRNREPVPESYEPSFPFEVPRKLGVVDLDRCQAASSRARTSSSAAVARAPSEAATPSGEMA